MYSVLSYIIMQTLLSTGRAVRTDMLVVCYQGSGDGGQLGDGSEMHRLVPQHIGGRAEFAGARIVVVSAGEEHSAAQADDGSVYTWGTGTHGCLGSSPQLTPRRVPNLPAVRMVACGDAHTLALTDREVWAWGMGAEGQLGQGHRQNCVEPARIVVPDADDQPVFVAAGARHSLAVTAQGSVLSWGAGGCGRLGLHDEEDRLLPTALAHSDLSEVLQVLALAARAGVCEYARFL